MTKKNALTIAINALSLVNTEDASEATATLTKMIESLNGRTLSEEAKAKQNEKRKIATAQARAELVSKIAPVLREGLSHTLQGVTAKELFELVKGNLPENFTANKVQNILLREMKPELDIIEAKNKANLYRLVSIQ